LVPLNNSKQKIEVKSKYSEAASGSEVYDATVGAWSASQEFGMRLERLIASDWFNWD